MVFLSKLTVLPNFRQLHDRRARAVRVCDRGKWLLQVLRLNKEPLSFRWASWVGGRKHKGHLVDDPSTVVALREAEHCGIARELSVG